MSSPYTEAGYASLPGAGQFSSPQGGARILREPEGYAVTRHGNLRVSEITRASDVLDAPSNDDEPHSVMTRIHGSAPCMYSLTGTSTFTRGCNAPDDSEPRSLLTSRYDAPQMP
jgi:hypothetical protein